MHNLLVVVDPLKQHNKRIWISVTSDGDVWVDAGRETCEEFIRGSFEKIPVNNHWLYKFLNVPSLADIMRFAGFCYEHGVTVFDGVQLDVESAKTPLTEYELFLTSRTHVLMNIRR